MIEHAALQERTVVEFPADGGTWHHEAERTPDGWTEVNAHCVDCVNLWHPDGTPANYDAGDAVLDMSAGTVTHVPAEWLRLELLGLIDSLDEHVTPEDVGTALRNLAIDAGLS